MIFGGYRSAVGACVRRLGRQPAKLNRTTSRALTDNSKAGLQSTIQMCMQYRQCCRMRVRYTLLFGDK